MIMPPFYSLLANSKPVDTEVTTVRIPKSSQVNIINSTNNKLGCSFDILTDHTITLNFIGH